MYGPGMPLNIYQSDIIHDNSVNIKFISQGLKQEELVALYNCADFIVSYSTAEGFGLSTAEGLACGKPFIAPVIGGLQDQMGFED
jgi:glycosyltransferase involved in cell wall biosynthesis